MSSHSRCYIFDLDGVLVDTKDAVRKAYEIVGVYMPDEAWGRPFAAWGLDYCNRHGLDPREVHKEKNRHFKRLAKSMVRALPPLHQAHKLYENDRDVRILTAASGPAYLATQHLTKPLPVLGTGCDNVVKYQLLKALGEGVYIDDHEISVPHGWELITYNDGVTREDLECMLLS